MFGHIVRGPLKLLKEKFFSQEDAPMNLLQYVSVFRSKLFLLLRNFSVAISVSPHVCFILVVFFISVFLR